MLRTLDTVDFNFLQIEKISLLSSLRIMIIFVIRNGLRWQDAPKDYGLPKTIYNRFIRWSRLGIFDWILSELSGMAGKPD